MWSSSFYGQQLPSAPGSLSRVYDLGQGHGDGKIMRVASEQHLQDIILPIPALHQTTVHHFR